MFYDFYLFGQGVPNETKGTINLKRNENIHKKEEEPPKKKKKKKSTRTTQMHILALVMLHQHRCCVYKG